MSPRDQPRSLALLLLSLVSLVAVGLWTHSVVRKSVRDRTADRLHLVMNSMYEGLNAWLDGQHSLVRWIAAEPAVRGDLIEIAQRAPGLTAEQLRRLPARGRLVERLHDHELVAAVRGVLDRRDHVAVHLAELHGLYSRLT